MRLQMAHDLWQANRHAGKLKMKKASVNKSV